MSLTDEDVEIFLELEESKTTERRSVDDGLSDYIAAKEKKRLEDLPPPELDAYLALLE